MNNIDDFELSHLTAVEKAESSKILLLVYSNRIDVLL
jgi:transcription initiation factor IIE alpha subunit